MIGVEEVLSMMNESGAVYLATLAGGRPRIRALVNLRRQDLYAGAAGFCRSERFTAYFMTSMSSGKVREIRADPAVAVYYCDPANTRGVELSGSAEVLSDLALKKTLWHDAWVAYWPAGVADPDCVVVRVRPAAAAGWWGSTPFRLDAIEL